MKVKLTGLTAILLAGILVGCRAERDVPTQLPPSATEQPETVVRGREGTLVIEDDKLYVAIVWHQHQPFYYQDPQTGIYEKPWVRLHAAKDYVDMVAILRDYPGIHVTFNLTPSLLEQLDAIADGTQDLYLVHAQIPADELTDEQKQFLLDRFFDINPKIIARFARYLELSRNRDEESIRTWSTQDFRDLQVLFNLAWTDPDWLALEPLASLVSKGQGYSEADKLIVFNEHLRLVREVIPLHADLQRAGQIEITTTPYAHPILPLLVNSDLASIALPEAVLPTRFAYGQDAVAQVDLGIESYVEHFGVEPLGMWPAEGSVAESVVTMISNAGIRWMASDEDVLAKSLPDMVDFTRDPGDTVLQPDALYQVYSVEGMRGEPVAIIFRDRRISDKIGFEYSGTPGVEAASDFIGRLEAIHARLQEQDVEGPHLVTILLDGENAWEHYPNDGKDFLHEMYRLLSHSATLVTVTPSEYIEALDSAGVEPAELDSLWAGSWIDGTFSTWIGEQEENTAWEYLRRTREALQEQAETLDQTTFERARRLIFKAEGSDWFWWYGNDQTSGADDNFDRQFRSYLEQIYTTIDLPVPDYVSVPVIPQARQLPDQEPLDLLTVTLDGTISEDEWVDAGWYQFEDTLIDAVYFGYSLENLYVRIDLEEPLTNEDVLGLYLSSPYGQAANAYSRHGSGETQIGFGAKELFEVSFSAGRVIPELFIATGSGGWVPGRSARALEASLAPDGRTLELALNFMSLYPQARSGDRINMRLILSQGGIDQDVLPPEGPALATIPDLPIPNVFLEVEDPRGDDHGPGNYQYPRDTVFKSGVFDLVGLTVGYDDTDVIWRLQFSGPVINEWGSPNGLSIQTIDIYIDVDGPVQGARILLPGRNAALTSDYGWDYAIWAEGWTPGIYMPGQDGPLQIDSGFSITTNPGQRRVTIRAPRSLLSGNPATWSYTVVVLSQEGYPSAGVWRVRDVQVNAEQWRIGGGAGAPGETRIMDLLWPGDSTPMQEELLGYRAPAGLLFDALAADQYPQVPMIKP